MLLVDVPLGKAFIDCSQVYEVSPSSHGGGDTAGWLQRNEALNTHKPRALRWLNAKQAANEFLAKVIGGLLPHALFL